MEEITEHGKFTTVMAKICKDNCPVCVKGREKGEGFLYNMVKLEDKLYLFAYFEYVGEDLEADMAKMADDPETQRWWKETDPCQKRLPGTPEGQQWLKISEVFHTD